jgi:murein DD-endopeptidase MepM/ murein hydrolase activator NlpD
MDVILIRKNLEKGKRNYLNHPIFVPVTLVSMLTMATVGYSAYSHYSGDSYDHILSLSLKNSSSVFNVEEAFSDNNLDELTERVNTLETKATRLDKWGEQLVLTSQTQELDMSLSWDQIIIEQQRAAQRELEEERAAQRKLEEERAAQRELEEEHALQQKLEEERALQQLDRQIAQNIEEERLAQKREEERVAQKFDEERAAQKLERQLFAQKREEERVVQKFEKERVAQKLERQLAQKLEEERAAQKFERQLAQNTRFSTVRSKPVQIAQLAQQRGQQTVRTKRADQKTDFSLSWDNIINDRPYFAQSKERGTTQSKERGTTISRFSPIAELKRSIQIVSRNMLRQYRSRVKRLPEGWPLGKGRVSSKFGWRGKRMHKGIDIAAKRGTPIYAVEDGFVERSKYLRGYGNLVEISHSEMYSTRYGHNSKNLVQEGDVVFKGQVIALVGSTGRSTGPHVHFEVRQSGVAINPIKYLGVMENFTLTENIKLSEHVKLSRR